MNDRKRAAPAATAGSSKKRKVANVQKFYGVLAGFAPGVYMNYADCQRQTTGFKGAVFQSFTSREDAEDFVAGKKVAPPANKPQKFYAVAVGSPTGIYTDWSDASEAIKGVKKPKYKKFNTRAEAVDYIKQFGSPETIEALGETVPQFESQEFTPIETPVQPKADSKKTPAKAPAKIGPPEDAVIVYTDGSSLANGRAGSRAGLGVFFPNGDARNISEPLPGKPQTNQRAELMAMLRALEVVPVEKTMWIFSDSQYSINCVTQWAKGWEKKGWKTATGDDVKNQDIIRAILTKMREKSSAGSKVEYQWVKGHANDPGNVAADQLAVRGANMAPPS